MSTPNPLTAPISLADASELRAHGAEQDAEVLLPFSTVVVGASAGGVEALSRLLALMPANTGCSFIVVLHLPAHHRSMLASLLGRVTTMPVRDAEHGARPQPDHVYTLPSGHHLLIQQGRFVLEPIHTPPPKPMTVDRLMMSLAADQHGNVVGIVLTGADGDGALGIKAIKSEGGMTIAQEPGSASHPSMPEAAIATGQVDRQLLIEDMPAALQAFVRGALPVEGQADDGSRHDRLAAMLQIVRERLELDFSGYKTPMLLRRVRRRIGLLNDRGMDAYLERLRKSPAETEALAADFLISVTEFFREPLAWQALSEHVLPALVATVPDNEELRVWVPGCASGEEAYSLAMLATEALQQANCRARLRVFATDIDRRALDVARRGHYPREIENRISAARLKRFFQVGGDGFQVSKALRERVTFAVQNVLSDPPYSRMHIVSCRNLLIYMRPQLQQRVLKTFEFALRPGGVLVLGKSESISSREMLFTPAVPHANISRRVRPPGHEEPPNDPASRSKDGAGSADGDASAQTGAARASSTARDAADGSTAPGAGNGAADATPEHADGASAKAAQAGASGGPADESVQDELRRTRRELSVAITELEQANAELKIANEEAMSTNEEMQSANEELATSKEELESVNEELVSVNHQFELKIDELESVNDDLGNLLASTHIPTLFLDTQLHIKRFTPAATRLFKLIATDLNRPLTDIASEVDMPALIEDARRVLHTLEPLETETEAADGDCHLRRTMPYRTVNDAVGGVVVTFTDITRLKQAREGANRFVALMTASNDAIIVFDPQGPILAWNQGAESLYGYRADEVMQHDIFALLGASGRDVYTREIARLQAGARPRVVDTRRQRRDGSSVDVSLSMSMIPNDERPRRDGGGDRARHQRARVVRCAAAREREALSRAGRQRSRLDLDVRSARPDPVCQSCVLPLRRPVGAQARGPHAARLRAWRRCRALSCRAWARCRAPTCGSSPACACSRTSAARGGCSVWSFPGTRRAAPARRIWSARWSTSTTRSACSARCGGCAAQGRIPGHARPRTAQPAGADPQRRRGARAHRRRRHAAEVGARGAGAPGGPCHAPGR